MHVLSGQVGWDESWCITNCLPPDPAHQVAATAAAAAARHTFTHIPTRSPTSVCHNVTDRPLGLDVARLVQCRQHNLRGGREGGKQLDRVREWIACSSSGGVCMGTDRLPTHRPCVWVPRGAPSKACPTTDNLPLLRPWLPSQLLPAAPCRQRGWHAPQQPVSIWHCCCGSCWAGWLQRTAVQLSDPTLGDAGSASLQD